MIGGYGISSTIWSQLQLAIVNPDNVNAEAEVEGGEAFFDDPEVLGRVPTLLGIMTALYAALMTLGMYVRGGITQPRTHLFEHTCKISFFSFTCRNSHDVGASTQGKKFIITDVNTS